MRRDDVTGELEALAFEFFFWFSRFEFALKENAYLQNRTPGAQASPGWDAFVSNWRDKYTVSAAAHELLTLAPKRQVVGENHELGWKEEDFAGCGTPLSRVVRLLKNVRNNLFHGGKHGVDGWDDPTRTSALLRCSKAVLDQLSGMAGLDADYTRYY